MAVLTLNTSGIVAEPRAAATVIVMRDSAGGPEALLLRRNKALEFAGGLWVFPGGAIDDADVMSAGGDALLASRVAALREAQEESSLEVSDDGMELLGYWTTPVVEKRRFHTAFFVAGVTGTATVSIDGGEIHDAQWVTPEEAVRLHNEGQLGLLPPTYLTLIQLTGHSDVSHTLRAVQAASAIDVMPVVAMLNDAPLIMLPGDAGYDSGDPACAGPRNRCCRIGSTWRYDYEQGGRRFDAL